MSLGRGTRIVKIAKAGGMPKPDPVEIDNCLVSANAQVVCGRERMDVVNIGLACTERQGWSLRSSAG